MGINTNNMGPVLVWPKEQGPSPVCNGSCASGWSYDYELCEWVCATCRKMSHGCLKLCEICDQVYLYKKQDLGLYRIEDFNPAMPRVLPHKACHDRLEELTNG